MIIKIFGLAFLFAVSAFILKAFGWKGAPLVSVAALIGMLMLFIERLGALYDIFLLIKKEEEMTGAVESILKILGVGYVSGISSDICRELGEPAIASAVQSLARIESMVIISPLIMEILTLGLELVK